MTENQIIKALECCGKLTHHGWGENMKICEEECPYKANCYDEENNINMISDVLDLINRQQEEKETMQSYIDCLKSEIERLKSDLHDCVREVAKSHEIDKNKAIKEFAERLKALDRLDVDVSYGYGREHYTEAIAVNLIDNLVKEMVGEDETT